MSSGQHRLDLLSTLHPFCDGSFGNQHVEASVLDTSCLVVHAPRCHVSIMSKTSPPVTKLAVVTSLRSDVSGASSPRRAWGKETPDSSYLMVCCCPLC